MLVVHHRGPFEPDPVVSVRELDSKSSQRPAGISRSTSNPRFSPSDFFSFLDVKKFLRGGGGRENARETRKRRLGRERKGGGRGRGIRRVEKKKKKEKRERNNRERERERCAEEEGQGRREGQERIGIVAAVETRFTVVVEPIDTRQPSRPTAAVAAAGAGGIEAASLDGEARSTALLRIEATH